MLCTTGLTSYLPCLAVDYTTGHIGVVCVPGLLGGDTCAVMQNLHWCIYSVDRCGKSVHPPLTDRELVQYSLLKTVILM